MHDLEKSVTINNETNMQEKVVTNCEDNSNSHSHCCSRIPREWQPLCWHLFVLNMIQFLANLVNSGTTIFIPLAMGTNYHYAGILTSCIAFGSTIIGPGAGYIISITSSEFGFILAFILRVLSLSLMYFITIYSNSDTIIFIVWFIACGIFGISLALLNIGLSDYASINVKDDSKRGKFLSYVMFVSRVAFIAGPFMNGLISDAFNGIESMLLLNLGLVVAGLIISFLLLIPPQLMNNHDHDQDQDRLESIEINSFSQFCHTFRSIGWNRLKPSYWMNSLHTDDDDDNACINKENSTDKDNANTNRTNKDADDNAWATVENKDGEDVTSISTYQQWDKQDDKQDQAHREPSAVIAVGGGDTTDGIERDWVEIEVEVEGEEKLGGWDVTKYVCSNYWLLIVTIGIFGFGMGYARRTRKLILTFEAESLNLSDSEIGIINTLSYTPCLVLFLFSGYMMDRFGRKSTGIPSLVIFIIGLMFVPFTKTFEQLVGVSVIFGVADGISVGLLMTMTTDIAPNEDNYNAIQGSRAQFLGLVRTSWTWAEVLSPIVVGYLSSDISIFYACLTTAIITGVSLLWLVCFVPETINYQKNINLNRKNLNRKNVNTANDENQPLLK